MIEKNISELKEEYEKIEKIFGLPSFREMQEDFDIEKTLEKPDGILIRDIRRAMSEKIGGYSHFFEILITTSSAPMYVFYFMKNLSIENEKEIKELYKEISRMQIRTIKLDTTFDEKNEADFIKNTFEKWQIMKKRIYALVDIFEKEFEKNLEHKEKSYFG